MPLNDGAGRIRVEGDASRRLNADIRFNNPYPWMSGIEARVYIELENHNIPFSWRYFDGASPTFTELLGTSGYQPEFTILELKTIVLVQGSFWGTLSGTLDRVALAAAAFQLDGWNVVTLWETDILAFGAWNLLVSNVPGIATLRGPKRPNPYDTPETRAQRIRRTYILRQPHGKIILGKEKYVNRIPRLASLRRSDTGRRRISSKGAVADYRTR